MRNPATNWSRGFPRGAGRRLAALAGGLIWFGLTVVPEAVVAQTNYFFTNATTTAQSWSLPIWSNTLNSAATAPPSGGSTDYLINFNGTAAFNATNDLGTAANGGFQLNQLIFNAGTPTLFGSNLVLLTSSTGVGPQVLQNTASSLTINNGLVLSNTATFGGSGSGTLTLNSTLSGAGGLTMTGGYTLEVTYNTSLNYTGNTTVSGGILQIDHDDGDGGPQNQSLKGTLLLNGGQLAFTEKGAGNYNPTLIFTNAIQVGASGGTISFNGAANSFTESMGLLTLGGSLTVAGVTGTPNGGGGAFSIGNSGITLTANAAIINATTKATNSSHPIVLPAGITGPVYTLTLGVSGTGGGFTIPNPTATSLNLGGLTVGVGGSLYLGPLANGVNPLSQIKANGGLLTMSTGSVLSFEGNISSPGSKLDPTAIAWQGSNTLSLTLQGTGNNDSYWDVTGNLTVGTASGLMQLNYTPYRGNSLTIDSPYSLTVSNGGTLNTTVAPKTNPLQNEAINGNLRLLNGAIVAGTINTANKQGGVIRGNSGTLALGDGTGTPGSPSVVTIQGNYGTDLDTFNLGYANFVTEIGTVKMKYSNTTAGAGNYFNVGWSPGNGNVTLTSFYQTSGGTEFAPLPGSGGIAVIGPSSGTVVTFTNPVTVSTAGSVGFYNVGANNTRGSLGAVAVSNTVLSLPMGGVVSAASLLNSGIVTANAGGLLISGLYTNYGTTILINGILSASGLINGVGNTISNSGGILQFSSAAPTITANGFGNIAIANGTISFTGVNNADVNSPALANISFAGANTFMLNAASNTAAAASQTYTFGAIAGNPSNYVNLTMVNGQTAYGNGSVTISNSSVLLVSNTLATFSGPLTNKGTAVFVNSVGTFSASAYNSGTWFIDPSTNNFAGNLDNAGTMLLTNSVNIIGGNFINEATGVYSMLQTSATYVAGVFSNQAAFSIINASMLTNGNAFISGGVTVLVSDAGSVWNNLALNLGNAGTLNSVIVSNGATVSANSLTFGASNNTFSLGGLGAASTGTLRTITLTNYAGSGVNQLTVTNAALSASTLTLGSNVLVTLNTGSAVVVSNNASYIQTFNGTVLMGPGSQFFMQEGGAQASMTFSNLGNLVQNNSTVTYQFTVAGNNDTGPYGRKFINTGTWLLTNNASFLVSGGFGLNANSVNSGTLIVQNGSTLQFNNQNGGATPSAPPATQRSGPSGNRCGMCARSQAYHGPLGGIVR